MAVKRIVPNSWYEANGIPTPKANLTLSQARKLVKECQAIKHDPEGKESTYTSPSQAHAAMCELAVNYGSSKKSKK
ncbi:MAG: hypothetical protein RLO17_14665 [Cyclobacteriaceae bacterium]